MSGQLKHEVAAYLVLRRSVGFKLEGAERVLLSFADYAASQGTAVITTRLALSGRVARPPTARRRPACACCGALPSTSRCCTRLARCPPSRLVPRPRHRPTPYIYSEDEVGALMAAARRLGPGLWPLTCEVAIGLMAATGMRVGEVLRLERAHVAFDASMLTVLSSKFAKSRHVPLSPSTLDALRRYDELRAANFPPLPPPSSCRPPGAAPTTWACTWPSVPCCRPQASLRAQLPVGPACTTCAIRWTAGLCALLACGCW